MLPSAAVVEADWCCSQAGRQGGSGPHAGIGPQPKCIPLKHCTAPPSLSPLPTIPVVNHIGSCRLQSIDSLKLAEFAGEQINLKEDVDIGRL